MNVIKITTYTHTSQLKSVLVIIPDKTGLENGQGNEGIVSSL